MTYIEEIRIAYTFKTNWKYKSVSSGAFLLIFFFFFDVAFLFVHSNYKCIKIVFVGVL